jgi:SAM-dependent methyltransferase
MTEPDDSDSAIGASLRGSSTTSLSLCVQEYPEENGRTYHSYKKGKYWWPNDEGERDRLDLQHHLFKLTLDGKLCICPIDERKGNIHRVLDVGTGTGIWALDFGDDYPEAHVVGIDLSPIQPPQVAPNVEFIVDDLEEPWIFSHKFDFIHSRMMTGSFRDWPQFFEQSLE